MATIFAFLGRHTEIPQLNSTYEVDYAEFYRDPVSIDLVGEIFSSDISYGGYRYLS